MKNRTERQRFPAKHRVLSDGGRRYAFYCDLSGMLVYTTSVIPGSISAPGTPSELQTAWEEAKPHFNFCQSCGRNVCNEMFNADKLECVDCSPWVNKPRFCSLCGARLNEGDNNCTNCGARIQKEGVDDDAEALR